MKTTLCLARQLREQISRHVQEGRSHRCHPAARRLSEAERHERQTWIKEAEH